MFQILFWGLNIWGVKKTLDLMKENTQLKQKSSDDEATIRTLGRSVYASTGSSIDPESYDATFL